MALLFADLLLLLLLPQAAEKDELSARSKGDVVAGLLPLVDNFELARTQVKPETEGEQKINNSYQVRPAWCPALGSYYWCTCWGPLVAQFRCLTTFFITQAVNTCCTALAVIMNAAVAAAPPLPAGPVQADGGHHEGAGRGHGGHGGRSL
jgi:hypothetical protein